jgi:hypothetical protein
VLPTEEALSTLGKKAETAIRAPGKLLSIRGILEIQESPFSAAGTLRTSIVASSTKSLIFLNDK